MKKINSRQLLIFYFIYSFGIKFLMLPSFLSAGAGRDAWIAAGVGALVELGLLFVVLLAMERKSSTKILMPLLFAFFLLQALITLTHTNFLLSHTIYENLGKHMFVIPILVLGVFFVFSKIRAVFRSGEIFYILILVAIFLAVLPALWKADPSEVFQGSGGGVTLIFHTVFNNLIYFEGALILLVFKGEVEVKKNFKRNFMIWAAIGAVVFTAFVFFFISLFGPLSGLRELGIVDVTGQNAYLAQNVRLEWIIVCVWLLLLLMRFGVLFYSCFATIANKKMKPAFFAPPLALVVYVLFMFLPLELVLGALRIPIAIFLLGVPLLFLIWGGRNHVKD